MDATNFLGQSITFATHAPFLGSIDFGPATAVVGDGGEYSHQNWIFVDVSASQISIFHAAGISYGFGSFNGEVITDSGNALAPILGAAVWSMSGLIGGPGATASSDADNVYINLASSSFNAGVSVVVQVSFTNPVANDDIVLLPSGSGSFNVLTNDTDADFNELRLAGIQNGPQHGQVTFLANGQVTYTADAGYTGPDRFDYTVTDGVATRTATVRINPAPVITSDGGGDTATLSIEENNTAVTTVTADDADGVAPLPTFSIEGGADRDLFEIDPMTGALTFVTAPDFENGDNSYEVVVRATEGADFDEQTITVDVTNVNDVTPAIASDGGGDSAIVSVAENATAVTTVTADDDGPSLTFSLEGGADEALFAIDPESGELRFLAPPNHEGPGDNSYEVVVRASDGASFDEQTITVNVTDVNDVTPEITSDGGGPTAAVAIEERTTAVTTVTVTDADGPAPTFSIVGGADQTRFTINAASGALAFSAMPDFEQPGDADGDNIYAVVVRASDGTLSDDQAITVEILDDLVSGADVALGIGDVLWRHDDGTVATGTNDLGIIGPNWQIAATGDFDGDGDSDIAWRHNAGLTTIWEMEDGAYVINHNQGIVGTAWQIAGTGDFDADGDSDILWRHDDGQLVNWEMEDGAYVENHNLATASQNWQVAGTGDFDADGDADILWRHNDGPVVLWEMQDGNFVTNHSLPDVATNWQIRGTGDFDRDGDADILWRHNGGQVVTWEMENAAHVQSRSLADVSTNWQIAGTWDFDSDDDSDILWRHNDGSVVVWTMEDGGIWQTQNVGAVANAWHIRGTGEFDLL